MSGINLSIAPAESDMASPSSKELHEKYTGECMNNAYLGGVAAGIIVTASLYLFQRKARPVAGFNNTAYFLTSAAFGAFSGYLITDAKIIECKKTLKQKLENESRNRRAN